MDRILHVLIALMAMFSALLFWIVGAACGAGCGYLLGRQFSSDDNLDLKVGLAVFAILFPLIGCKGEYLMIRIGNGIVRRLMERKDNAMP